MISNSSCSDPIIGTSGGVELKVGNDTIGGVGLVGSPGVYEPCERAGIDRVKDRLR